jgi:hypothetical protein
MRAKLPHSLVQGCIYFLLTTVMAPAAVWDDAPDYGGWRNMDWFGYLYPMNGYILHAEHGWQFPVGDDPASFHVYDFSIGAWAWIGRDTYPWMYLYGSIDDWLFYYKGGSSGNRWFYEARRDLFHPESDLIATSTDKPTIQVSREYSHPEAFPPGFNLSLSGDLTLDVLTGDPSAVRYETEVYEDYNTAQFKVKIFAPVGTQLAITGALSVIPNMQSGSYGDSPENQINWALSGFDMILYPPDVFNSASTTSAAVDTTAEITSTGISKQFFVQSYAEFRTDTNGYLGRFDGWIMVTIQGE